MRSAFLAQHPPSVGVYANQNICPLIFAVTYIRMIRSGVGCPRAIITGLEYAKRNRRCHQFERAAGNAARHRAMLILAQREAAVATAFHGYAYGVLIYLLALRSVKSPAGKRKFTVMHPQHEIRQRGPE
jgi:hypothetical protein